VNVKLLFKLPQGNTEAIRLVNEAAEKYFVGNAQALKQLEMVENSLREMPKWSFQSTV
jgi:hypothetical protein